METYDLLENNILQIANGKVIKKNKSRFSSLLYLLSGIVLMSLNTKKMSLFNNEVLTLFLFFIGMILLVWGIISFLIRKDQYVCTDTGKCLKKYSLEFDSQEFENMRHLYEKNNFKEMSNLKRNNHAGLILNLMGTEEGNIYYSQILKYIPYSFVPANEGQIHDEKVSAEIRELITLYNKQK